MTNSLPEEPMHIHPTAPSQSSADEEYLPVPWAVLESYRCFGCSPHNANGLRLRFAFRPDGIATRFRLDRTHESYPGVVHGGLIGVICDETMGNLIVLRTGLTSFTTGMRLRYVTAMRVNTDYQCVARLQAGTAEPVSNPTGGPTGGPTGAGGLVRAEAEILDAAGSLVAAASATYRPTSMNIARQRLDLRPDEFDRVAEAITAAQAAQAANAVQAANAAQAVGGQG
ncbi:PaaI family thioesterase [Frankia casuarinae]|uniref:Thioesterase superfamily n=2 Tax=Frankia TaxID=1854 RepID=Q2J5C2_FRACC|nr:PaaI family thioesterase [Frankia casuarinae]ABD13520.1 hypothetical protein Francci3_4172 [Frankia casuarinae]